MTALCSIMVPCTTQGKCTSYVFRFKGDKIEIMMYREGFIFLYDCCLYYKFKKFKRKKDRNQQTEWKHGGSVFIKISIIIIMDH